MKIINKLAVLITGIFIIILVGWIFSITMLAPSTNLNPDDGNWNNSPKPKESDSGWQPSTNKSSANKQKSHFSGDTVAWRTGSSSKTAPDVPVVSGKIPFSNNPNQVFIRAAKQILPSVVSIHSIRRIQNQGFNFLPPFLKKDHDDQEDNEGFYQPGAGSGIIISADGYIMTNYHVVENTEELQVTLFDKRDFRGRLVGGDPTTDIAVVKINQKNLPVAVIGNSDGVEIGEWVMAVGNPLNFTSTVTTGIVSALGRNINIIDSRYRYRVENFIQTDAVINPGNSGGALINLNGEVIGINTAIATRNGFYQGYGFAIPVNLVQKVVNDVLKFGRVRRAILGVTIEPVSDVTARAVGLKKPTGALIQRIASGSAAAAKLQPGDIILAVNGSEIISVNDLQVKIAQHHPGEIVRLVIWRDGKEVKLKVPLGEAPSAGNPATANANKAPPKFENLGLFVQDLSEQIKEQYSVESGLFIIKVDAGSPSEKAGVLPFTIIISIDDTPISTVEEFVSLVKQADSGDYLKFVLKEAQSTDVSNKRILFIEVP